MYKKHMPWNHVFLDVKKDAVYMSYRGYSLLMHNLYLYPFVERDKLIIRKGGAWHSIENIFIESESHAVEGKGNPWPMVKLWSRDKNPKMYDIIASTLPRGITFGNIINNKFVAPIRKKSSWEIFKMFLEDLKDKLKLIFNEGKERNEVELVLYKISKRLKRVGK